MRRAKRDIAARGRTVRRTGPAVLLALALFAGCATAPPPRAPSQPAWIANPKSDDSVCVYRMGSATARPDRESARQQAFADALSQISQSILSSVTAREGEATLVSEFLIRGAEIMPGCVHYETDPRGFSCWVQVAYPQDEKAKLVSGIQLGEELKKQFDEAVGLQGQGDHAGAMKRYQDVIARSAAALYAGFRSEDAQLRTGDCLREQRRCRAARTWYARVLGESPSEEWRQTARARLSDLDHACPPRRFDPMYDRWGGGKVALLCLIREGTSGPARYFKDLAALLSKECDETEFECVDISPDAGADAAGSLFDRNDLSAASARAAAEGAGILLAVLFEVDPARRGKTEDLFGTQAPVTDSVVRYVVVRPQGAVRVYGGQFKAMAGQNSDATLAGYTAAILITKYLVPHCPGITGQP